MEEIKDLRQSLTQITLKNWIEIKKLTFLQHSTEGEPGDSIETWQTYQHR